MSQYPFLDSLEKFGINLGLERINHLLKQLNNPQARFKSIHIAGTNGKGSTAAMLASILKEAGYKVGLYTSPHLLDYNERIKINGRNISRRYFEEGLRRVKKAAEGMMEKNVKEGMRKKKEMTPTLYPSNHLSIQPSIHPTIFEALTAVAFWYFAKEKVDYAIVEVGMGGRLDATNVITPLVSVITNIELEHTEVLGKTLSKIAKEKAGIIKPGVPIVTAECKAAPLKVIKKICREKGCALTEIKGVGGRALGTEKVESSSTSLGASRKWIVESRNFNLALRGPHQHANAACALSALWLAKISVTARAIRQGLSKVNWPGRLQILSKNPLIIADGAHNPAGARTLQVTIKQLYNGQKFTLIFGCQKTKQYQKMLSILKPITKQLIITRSSNAQAAEVKRVYQWARRHFKTVQMTDSFSEAFMQFSRTPLIVTGSLFLVADALKCLDAKAIA